MNPDRDKNVTNLYTISYTLTQKEADSMIAAMEEMRATLIEEVLNFQDFEEANSVIAKIKAKL